MFDNPDGSGFDARAPRRFPRPNIEYASPEPTVLATGVSQIYAAAWTMAQRDHELDRLFNPDYYQAGEI